MILQRGHRVICHTPFLLLNQKKNRKEAPKRWRRRLFFLNGNNDKHVIWLIIFFLGVFGTNQNKNPSNQSTNKPSEYHLWKPSRAFREMVKPQSSVKVSSKVGVLGSKWVRGMTFLKRWADDGRWGLAVGMCEKLNWDCMKLEQSLSFLIFFPDQNADFISKYSNDGSNERIVGNTVVDFVRSSLATWNMQLKFWSHWGYKIHN